MYKLIAYCELIVRHEQESQQYLRKQIINNLEYEVT